MRTFHASAHERVVGSRVMMALLRTYLSAPVANSSCIRQFPETETSAAIENHVSLNRMGHFGRTLCYWHGEVGGSRTGVEATSHDTIK